MECYKERINAVLNGFKVIDRDVILEKPEKIEMGDVVYRVSFKTGNNSEFYTDFTTSEYAKIKYQEVKKIEEYSDAKIIKITEMHQVMER